MNYEEFKEQLINYLKQDFPESEYEYVSRVSNKTNVAIDSLIIRPLDGTMAPIIYPEQSYELYHAGHAPQFVFSAVSHSLAENFKRLPSKPEITLESAKKNLYCSILNKASNEHLLKDAPYLPFLDLAIVARWRVEENGSFLVTKDICQLLALTPEEILELAQKNTDKQEVTVTPMHQVIFDIIRKQGAPDNFMEELEQELDGRDLLYVLSNDTGMEGAYTIYSKDALQKAYETIGENFAILPSSRHELVLVAESQMQDIDSLEELVKDANQTVLINNDWLSDEVYHYDGETKSVDFARNRLQISEQSMDKSKSQGRTH